MPVSRLSRLTAASFLLASAGLLSTAAHAAGQTLVPAQSEVTFTAKQLGVPLPGRFKRFSAQSSFDPRAPQSSQISFQVDLGSVSINPDSDVELVKPEWFNVPKFPTATFQSSRIKALGGGRFEVVGKLSIKGNARDLVVPVTIAQAGGLTTATGDFALHRLDFKVGDGDWADTSIVANDVQVHVKLVLQGVPAQ
jgi:polyisoprenoid-binding protein YceI